MVMPKFGQRDFELKCGFWLILAAAVLFGTSGTAQALAPEGAQASVVGIVRLSVGGVFLLLLTTLQGGWGSQERWPLLVTLCTAACMAVLQLCFFGAIARTGVALGTTIFIGSYPVFAGLLGLLVQRERPSRHWVLTTTLAIIGCSLLIGAGSRIETDLLGVILALGAGSAYAIYSVLVKGLLVGRSTVAVIAVVFCLGALFLSPFLASANLHWLTQPSGIAVSLYLGLVSAAAPYWLFARGVKTVPVSTAATLSLAEPFTAGLLGVFFLGEQLTPPAFVGMGLLLGSLLLLTIAPGALLSREQRKGSIT